MTKRLKSAIFYISLFSV